MKERPDLKRCPFCGTILMQAPMYSHSRLEIDDVAVGCPECDWWFSEHEANDHRMTIDEYANRRSAE